jgi:predicted phosphodiesterase
VTRIEGATLVALNSAAPRTAIVNGRVTDRQLGFAKRTFSTTPASDVRIVVIHHNLVEAPDDRRDPVLRGSARVLDALTDMKVDLVLGGHLHRAFLAEHARASAPQEKLLIVMSGTTTSGRGREAEKDRQSYNVVHIGDTTIEVRRFLSEPDAQGFVMVESITTPRRGKAPIVSEVGNEAQTSTSAGQGR